MRLPNMAHAQVPREKIEGYLLSSSHHAGRSKAEYFSRFGFNVDSWNVLAEALLRHAAVNEVEKVEDTPFGTRYTIRGLLDTPDERNPTIVVVWFIEKGEDVPRLVTAYPG
jgi:hypothetical protein